MMMLILGPFTSPAIIQIAEITRDKGNPQLLSLLTVAVPATLTQFVESRRWKERFKCTSALTSSNS
jgi:hypothetical protein